MNDFLQMGGYAGFVWSAFGLTALVLVGNLFAARAGFRSERERVRRRLRAGTSA